MNAAWGRGAGQRRLGAAVLALALAASLAVTGLGATAGADTKSDLAAARARLAELQSRISAQVADLATLHSQLNSLAVRVAVATGAYEKTLAELARTQADLQEAEAHYREVQDRLDQRAAAAYEEGSLGGLVILLRASSFADFSYRIEVVSHLSRADGDLSSEVQRTAVQLGRQRELIRAAQLKQGAILRELDAQRQALNQKLDDQQAALSELAAARAEASGLIDRLSKSLQAQEVVAVKAAIHGGTPIPFGQWAGYFLPALGAPTCRNNLVLVVAWESTEYTQAQWNPLATSYPMPGATYFAGAVKNYASMEDGITATVKTLENTDPARNYVPIVNDLRACADPRITAEAINQSAYCECRGSYPLPGLVPYVEANYDFYAKICTGC